MNSFEKIPSPSGLPGTEWKAKNNLGVIVNTGFARELISYEVGGARYLMGKETDKSGDDYIDTFYVDLAYQEGAYGLKLPQQMLNRIREDLPKAYAALGKKCMMDPPAKKRRTFAKDPNGKKFKSEDGVVVFINEGNNGVVYEWQGKRWLIPISDQRILVVDLAYKEGAYGVPVDKAMRQQIHNDLNEAWGAGLFPPLKGVPGS
jgi:hypothetical protein